MIVLMDFNDFIREFIISSAQCVLEVMYYNTDTVHIKSITARYGGRLSE